MFFVNVLSTSHVFRGQLGLELQAAVLFIKRGGRFWLLTVILTGVIPFSITRLWSVPAYN
jgi:hypothetical protein